MQTDTKTLSVPATCLKLWDIDLGMDYGIRTGGTFFASWQSDDHSLEMIVYRGNLSAEDLNHYDQTIVDGITCYTNKSAANWDGTNESGEWVGGTIYTQTLAFAQNGLVCTLAGTAGQKETSLDIVSLKTAQGLINRSASDYQHYQKAVENWTVGFQKGKISCSITITPPPLDQTAYLGWVNSENCSLVKDGDLEYYLLKHDDRADSPNSAAIAYLSEFGLIEIRAGVPYSSRNDVPREEMDFININLVERVIQKLFAKQ